MKTTSRLVIKYPKMIILLVISITVIMGFFASKVQIKAGIEEMFPDSNPIVQQFNEANDLFGGMTFAVLMIEDANILDNSTLHKIAELTQKLETVTGVEKVISLTNVERVKGSLFGIETSLLIEKIPETKAAEETLRSLISNDDQYIGSLISNDFTATGIMVSFDKELADTFAPIQEIQQLIAKYLTPEKIYLTGNPVAVHDAQKFMKKDILTLLPFVLGIFILILWLSFRSLSGVLLPLVTVLVSIIWTIGGVAICQRPLSIISVVLPVLLVSVGSAYTIHIIARLQEELSIRESVQEAIKNTINNVGIAVLLAGITTIVGFGSLIFSDLVIIREFALSTAFGIAVALIISIFFVPAIYVLIPPKAKDKLVQTKEDFLLKGLKSVFALVSKKSYLIFGVVLLMMIISLLGIPKLYPETGYLNYFKANSSIRQASALVDQRFGGSATLDVIIKGDVNNPELLAQMAAFQDDAAKIPGLNNPISIVTLLKSVNQALNGDDPQMKVIPTTREQIAQYLLLLNMSGSSMTKEYLTFDEQTSRIQFMMENMDGRKSQQVIQQVNELTQKHFGKTYLVEITGMPVLVSEISRILIHSQILSIIVSILLTFGITCILLKSFKRGLFCSLTIILTVIINFGIMSWFKIPLDIATTMIASIAVGIGIDYSIHIYSRYHEEQNADQNQQLALKTTIIHVGRANLFNALAVIAGFCVILFSSFPPLINFGGLTALTMIISFCSAILLLPALILVTRKSDNKSVSLSKKL